MTFDLKAPFLAYICISCAMFGAGMVCAGDFLFGAFIVVGFGSFAWGMIVSAKWTAEEYQREQKRSESK